jgi:hypothetical protein
MLFLVHMILTMVILVQDDPSELCEYYAGNHTQELPPPWLHC